MKRLRQRTLKNSIHCSGIGLHGGDRVAMTLHPAAAGTGILFRRTDIAGGQAEIRATWENGIETPLCTTIQSDDGVRIATIEHLMSAFYGCGIDNAVVELNGGEVPIMDGSAAPFVFLIDCAGTVELDTPRRALRVLKPVTVDDGERSASLCPGGALSVHFEIDFDSPIVDRQEWFTQIGEATYKREIARARTFGFLQDVDRLRAMGLAQGGSLNNAIVVSGDRVLNEGGLRFENEFVRHKVLDSVGDLFLIGAPIVGHFYGLRAGHSLTLRLVRQLMADESAWEWIVPTEDDLAIQDGATGAVVPPMRAVAAHA